MKKDFPDAIKDANDSTDAAAASYDENDHNMSMEGIDENKSLVTSMPHSGKIPKPKSLICNDCGIKFKGYIAYYQHQV